MTVDIERTITLTVNGVPREATVPVRRLLSDALRHDLGLTGTHVGCEHGVCGACTVLVDGAPVRSCLMLAVQVDGHEVKTVEGLAHEDHQETGDVDAALSSSPRTLSFTQYIERSSCMPMEGKGVHELRSMYWVNDRVRGDDDRAASTSPVSWW